MDGVGFLVGWGFGSSFVSFLGLGVFFLSFIVSFLIYREQRFTFQRQPIPAAISGIFTGVEDGL